MKRKLRFSLMGASLATLGATTGIILVACKDEDISQQQQNANEARDEITSYAGTDRIDWSAPGDATALRDLYTTYLTLPEGVVTTAQQTVIRQWLKDLVGSANDLNIPATLNAYISKVVMPTTGGEGNLVVTVTAAASATAGAATATATANIPLNLPNSGIAAVNTAITGTVAATAQPNWAKVNQMTLKYTANNAVAKRTFIDDLWTLFSWPTTGEGAKAKPDDNALTYITRFTASYPTNQVTATTPTAATTFTVSIYDIYGVSQNVTYSLTPSVPTPADLAATAGIYLTEYIGTDRYDFSTNSARLVTFMDTYVSTLTLVPTTTPPSFTVLTTPEAQTAFFTALKALLDDEAATLNLNNYNNGTTVTTRVTSIVTPTGGGEQNIVITLTSTSPTTPASPNTATVNIPINGPVSSLAAVTAIFTDTLPDDPVTIPTTTVLGTFVNDYGPANTATPTAFIDALWTLLGYDPNLKPSATQLATIWGFSVTLSPETPTTGLNTLTVTTYDVYLQTTTVAFPITIQAAPTV